MRIHIICAARPNFMKVAPLYHALKEETTYLGIPCLTLRPNTERPVTITQGTNQLCDVNNLMEKFYDILSTPVSRPEPIKYWDGKTANRIVKFLKLIKL